MSNTIARLAQHRRLSPKIKLVLGGVVAVVIAAVVLVGVLSRPQPFGANYSDCSAGARTVHPVADQSMPLFFVSGKNLSGPVLSSTELDKADVATDSTADPAAGLNSRISVIVPPHGAQASALWTPTVSLPNHVMAYIQGSGYQIGESGGEGNLVVSDTNGKNSHILRNYHDAYSPAVSPDGKRIAILNDGVILTISADGRHERGIPAPDNQTRSVTWSPNSVCMAGSDRANGRIFIVNLRTDAYTWLTPPGAGSFYPAWSPTGNEIAYAAGPSGILLITNLSTGRTRELVACRQSCSENWQPTWSPDGSLLAFTRTTTNSKQIFVIPSRGGTLRQVTRGPNQHACPSW